MHPTEETLDVLACEFDQRPKDAPSFFDLAGAIRAVERSQGTLVVTFDTAATQDVEAFVAAERRCCQSIGWDLSHSPALQLRIAATPGQRDIFEQFLTGGDRG